MQTRRIVSTLVLVLAALLAPGAFAQQEGGNIQGAWIVVSSERDGKPSAEVAGHRLTFSGDAFAIQLENRTLYKGTYSVEPGRKPAQIDFRHTEGDTKGKTWKGIYRLEGETLRICDNAPDMAKPRPAQFSTKPGSGAICIVFKRATG